MLLLLQVAGASAATSIPSGGEIPLAQPRPPVISLSGDGTLFLGGTDWSPGALTGAGAGGRPRSFGHISWRLSRTRAVGRGLIWFNDGVPDDAEGSFFDYPARIVASRPVHGLYRHLAISFSIDRVAIAYRRTYDKQARFWGAKGSSGPSLEYCGGGGTWGPQAHFEVRSAVGLTCEAALRIVGGNPARPQGALFAAGSDVFEIDGYNCRRTELDLQDTAPPVYTTGSARAECARAGRGFDASYRA